MTASLEQKLEYTEFSTRLKFGSVSSAIWDSTLEIFAEETGYLWAYVKHATHRPVWLSVGMGVHNFIFHSAHDYFK
jgi:hypothetical protein